MYVVLCVPNAGHLVNNCKACSRRTVFLAIFFVVVRFLKIELVVEFFSVAARHKPSRKTFFIIISRTRVLHNAI